MKTGTLLQSFLLAAGLILCGIPTVQAHYPDSRHQGSGKYHYLQNDRHSSWHTQRWSSSKHGKHAPERHWRYGKYDGRGDRRDHGDRWKSGKHDGRDDWRDHKDYRQHGKYDGRDAGRKGQRSHSAGIGYTGRS